MELFTPDFGLVFWMFIAFIILFAVLAKWCVKAIEWLTENGYKLNEIEE